MTESDYNRLVKGLKEDSILKGFPDIIPLSKTSGKLSAEEDSNSKNEDVFQGKDEEQIRLMNELCIILDYNDKPIGAGTKKLTHLMKNINKGLLHRAFSVFLFNKENKLLLQQRATEKITFPDMWTNTCCSHPLCFPEELGNINNKDEKALLSEGVKGVKKAAIRKLDHELGIKGIDVEDFQFLTRIHYKSPNPTDQKWGEHEIDYILIAKKEVEVIPNENEISAHLYVSKQELTDMMNDPKLVFTPWFKLICENYLFKWWDDLKNDISLKEDFTLHHLI